MDRFNKWVTLIGNLGVLLGLLLVTIELSQTNELMTAQDRFNRLTALTTNQYIFVENANLPEIVEKYVSGEELSFQERIASNAYLESIFRVREWSFNELPEEELPLEQWCSGMRTEWQLEYWERSKPLFESEFVAFIDNLQC